MSVWLQSRTCIFNLAYFRDIRVRFIERGLYKVVLSYPDLEDDYYETLGEWGTRKEAIAQLLAIKAMLKAKGISLVEVEGI